jgi:hypothetical protein
MSDNAKDNCKIISATRDDKNTNETDVTLVDLGLAPDSGVIIAVGVAFVIVLLSKTFRFVCRDRRGGLWAFGTAANLTAEEIAALRGQSIDIEQQAGGKK